MLLTNLRTSHEIKVADIVAAIIISIKAHSNNTQSAEPESTPPFPRQQSSDSTALITPVQDVRASLSRPNRFQNNQQVSKQKRKESYSHRHKAVRRPRFIPYLHYK